MNLLRKSLPDAQNDWSLPQKDMNDLLRAFSRGQDMFPKLEIREDQKTYKVSAELPGLSEEDIHLSLQDNTLFIEGERKEESKKEEKGFTRSEFSYGSFSRSVPFMLEVDPEKVSAVYKNGVLEVSIEKVQGASSKGRKISVRKE